MRSAAGGLALLRPAARAAYQLTAEGTELAGALRLLAHWGSRHTDPAPPHVRHPIEARWYCPICDSLVDDEPQHGEARFA